MDSKVLRPTMMLRPIVSSRNFFKSADNRQGSLLLIPIPRFLSIAAMRDTITVAPPFQNSQEILFRRE
jgi:hypothetical protein